MHTPTHKYVFKNMHSYSQTHECTVHWSLMVHTDSVYKQAHHGSMDHFVTHKGTHTHTHTHTYTSSDLWFEPEPCLQEQRWNGNRVWMEGRIETHEGRKERRTEEEAAGDVALCSDFCSFTYSLFLFLSLRRLCDISYRPRNPYHWPTVQPSFVAALSISLPAGQYRPVPRERYKKKEVWRPLCCVF